MARQNYRCAGCGMRVAEQYASKFRYCNYLGRYFCTGCHTNQLALVPARILHKWDFTRFVYFPSYLNNFEIRNIYKILLKFHHYFQISRIYVFL